MPLTLYCFSPDGPYSLFWTTTYNSMQDTTVSAKNNENEDVNPPALVGIFWRRR